MSKIHTTIGLYNNGSFKTNGVRAEHLESHIEYNKIHRPGRTLFVDGEVVHRGICMDPKDIQVFKERLCEKPIVVTTCTAPYQ